MDASVEAELKIRARIEAIFIKPPEAFTSKEDYDDYLETRETYICNLLFNEDAVATEGKIAEYQRQNHASIARQRALKTGTGGDGATTATVAQSQLQGSHQGPSKPNGVKGGFVPEAASKTAGALGSMPRPISTNYSEDSEGTLKVPLKGARLVDQTVPQQFKDLKLSIPCIAARAGDAVQWRKVAAASGWRPEEAMKSAFEQLSVHWT